MAQPSVSEYMTETPATISEDLLIADALDRMYSINSRHLPVVNDAGELVGVVTTRDFALAATIRGRSPDRTPVREVMTEVPFTCSPDTPLVEVVEHMERDRYGSVVVVDGGKPVGVFTTTDALRALRSKLVGAPVERLVIPQHEREPADDDAAPERRRRRAHAGASKYDGMVSWFLARL